MSVSLVQYARFLVVGGAVALITIGCRALIGRWLGGDTAFYYSVSVTVAYAIGIVISFCLNRQFTFQGSQSGRRNRQFLLFVGIALVGMVSTWLFSLCLRYGLRLERVAGNYAASLAFATAALLSSAITYPLNARFVFGNRDPSDLSHR